MLSVVVITKNEEKNIVRTVKSLLVPEVAEIIIIDSNSQDKTIEIVNGINDKRVSSFVYTTPPFTAARGRMEGAGRVKRTSRYLLFIDGDMEYCRDFTKHAISELESDGSLAAVMGQMDEIYYENDMKVGERKSVYDLNKLTVGGACFFRLSDYFNTPGFNPYLICDEEGFLYSYVRKNGKFMKRIQQKMIIHHTEKTGGKEKILSRLTDKKIGYYGVCLYFALNDKQVFLDFLKRNNKIPIVFIFWTLLICFAQYWMIHALFFCILIIGWGGRKFLNYTIYSLFSIFSFIKILLIRPKIEV